MDITESDRRARLDLDLVSTMTAGMGRKHTLTSVTQSTAELGESVAKGIDPRPVRTVAFRLLYVIAT